MAGLELFDRTAVVTFGLPGFQGKQFRYENGTGTRITFDIEKSSSSDPNKATISLYNLSRISRTLLEAPVIGGGSFFITLLAGYTGAPGMVFTGAVAKRGVVTEESGSDRVTTIEAGDGQLAYSEAQFTKSYDAGTSTAQVIAELAASLNIAVGPLSALPIRTYPTGVSFMGPARDALDELVGAESDWSIQDGTLQLVLKGGPTPETAISLTPLSGLIGSPSKSDDGVNIQSLLRAEIKPGRIVHVTSRDYNGFFQAQKVKHRGDTHSASWTTSIEAVPIT